jgi:hypothetical protein
LFVETLILSARRSVLTSGNSAVYCVTVICRATDYAGDSSDTHPEDEETKNYCHG